jgi:hypothetical protein
MPQISRGTVNIALANAKGIVLLTDSVQTIPGPSGTQYTTAQKLFRLDDKTVCSIAGFAAETFPGSPHLNTDVAGIMADFKEQLITHPVSRLEAKLRAIGHMVGFYIDLIANRNEVKSGPGTPVREFAFEVIVTGYDIDGKAKLEKLVITPVVRTAPDGHNYWSHTFSIQDVTLGSKLVDLLSGARFVSQDVLDHPQTFDASIVRKYENAKTNDGGESLTLDDIAELASYMASQTASKDKRVGGPDQIATMAEGSILKFAQPHFPTPPSPLHFALMVGLKVTGGLPMQIAGDAHFLWIRSEFVGIPMPGLVLDGNFFYGCDVRDSIVSYSGKLTDFDNTNTVSNCMMLPDHSLTYGEGDRIFRSFKWSSVPPNTPRLPVTVSPR